MNDHPNALELIRIANLTLHHNVLPDAKPEHLYPLRMIANALGIAARELESHDQNSAAEVNGLNALYADTANSSALHARNRQFARDIRHGKFEHDAQQETQLRQHLIDIARAKLSASYPKGLQAITGKHK